MGKRSKMSLVKKGTVVVIVDVATTMHPDDRKFIRHKLSVEKDHVAYVDTDDMDHLFAVCDDLATLSNVVINNPSGCWAGQFIIGRVSYLSGLSAMNGQAIYNKTFTTVHIPVYELSNTNDMVVKDLVRVV